MAETRPFLLLLFGPRNEVSLEGNSYLFMWGAYLCMGAYKHNVVVTIKMGAYICVYLWGAYLCWCLS